MKKTGRKLHLSFATLLWTVFPTIAFILISSFIGLSIQRHVYPPVVPVSGTSMKPLLHFGDLVFLKRVDPAKLHRGDIIAFRTTADVQQKWNVPGSYVHRIVAVEKGSYGYQFQTQGDNVVGKDPFWTIEQNIIGIYAGKIKGGGYPILFIRAKQGKILLGGILLISFLYWLLGILERRRSGQAVNVYNLATVVEEARRITTKMEEASHPPALLSKEPVALRPRDWLIMGDFLTGTLSPEAPAEIELARRIARQLEGALASSAWPDYEVALRADLPISTLNGILEGETLPDLAILARLGRVLAVSLLPN